MTKLDVKATIKSLGKNQKDVAIEYYGRTPKDEAEAKSLAVMFGRTFVNPGCNPTMDSLSRLADILHIDVVRFYVGDGKNTLQFTSPETGKHYLMIPID